MASSRRSVANENDDVGSSSSRKYFNYSKTFNRNVATPLIGSIFSSTNKHVDEPTLKQLLLTSSKYPQTMKESESHSSTLIPRNAFIATKADAFSQANGVLPVAVSLKTPHSHFDAFVRTQGSEPFHSPELLNQYNGGYFHAIQSINNASLPEIRLPIEACVQESFIYQCEFCSDQFGTDQLLIDHCARMHTKDVKCQHCDKKFYRDKDLHFHMRTHVKKGKGFKCQVCKGLFLKMPELRVHMDVHEKEDVNYDLQFKCDICDRTFLTFRGLQDHKKRFLHKQCEVCLEYFGSDFKLLEHFSIHVSQSPAEYNCYQCDLVFPTKITLKNHLVKHRSYECEQCSAKFRRKCDIISHLKMDCLKRTLAQCMACKKSFISLHDLKTHEKVHYERNRCEFCFKKFLHSMELVAHLETHKMVQPYKCKVCLVSVLSKRIFNFHLKSHIHQTNFKCEYCCRWFHNRHILNKHLKRHTNDKYKCNICTMKFSDSFRLQEHSRSHVDDGFQCDICGKSFRTRKMILLHMTDDHYPKKKCHICEKEFLNQNRLITHLKSHYVKVEMDEDHGIY